MDMVISNKIFNAFVFSNYLSVLRSLTLCSVTAAFNRVDLEIRNRLYDFLLDFSQAKVEFFWVPSHSGVGENKRVDGLSKLATESDFSCEFRVPSTTRQLKKKMLTITYIWIEILIINIGLFFQKQCSA